MVTIAILGPIDIIICDYGTCKDPESLNCVKKQIHASLDPEKIV